VKKYSPDIFTMCFILKRKIFDTRPEKLKKKTKVIFRADLNVDEVNAIFFLASSTWSFLWCPCCALDSPAARTQISESCWPWMPYLAHRLDKATGGFTFLEGFVRVHCLITSGRKVWPLSAGIVSGHILCSGC
jgi:hypothetical protein